jgi:peptide/nickel transport system substrate-binding protein
VVDDALRGRVSRRDFLRRAAALGLSFPAAGALLAACGATATQAPPTAAPSAAPTIGPTTAPTMAPTAAPTAAPTTAPTPAGPAMGGTLIFARQAEPATLLPCGAKGAADNASIWALPAIFSQLVEVHDADTPQPGLAETWEVAPDGLSATFKLRDAKFSNGDPVTAEDIAWSLGRFIDPNVNAYYAGVASSMKACTVVDAKTVRLEMKRIDGAFLDALAMFVPSILPKKYFESLGADEDARQTAFAEKPIGSGPFMLKSWTRGQSLELVKNPYFWREGQPYLDGLTFLYLPDDNTRLLKLKSGEAHIAADVPYNQIEAISKTEGLQVLLEDIAGWKGIWFNDALKPFDDHNFRLALNYATPKEAILGAVLFNAADIQNSIIARVKYTDPSVPAYPYDMEKAKASIAASSAASGYECSFVIVAGDAVEKQIAEILQAEWAKIGVKIKIEPVDVATIWARYGSMKEPNIFTFPGSFLSSDTLSEDNLAYVFFDPAAGASSFSTNYNNPAVVALVAELSGSMDEAKRKATFVKIQQQTMADAPIVPLYFTKARTGISTKVKGFRTQKSCWWKFEDVSLES